MKKIFTIITLLAINTITFSQRLRTEDFNYSVGQLTAGTTPPGTGANVSGGNWVWFSGTLVLQVTAGNLTYPNYLTSPSGTSNKVTLTPATTSAEDAYTQFATQTAPAVGAATVYASFLLNVNDVATLGNAPANGDFFAAFVTSTGITSTGTATYNAGRVYIRKGATANTFALGVSPNSPSGTTPTPVVFSPTDYSVSTVHLVTFAYTFAAGANNDTAKLFVDRSYSPTEPIPDASSVAVAGTEPADINRFILRQGFISAVTTPNADIDAIKISTNYADATLTAGPLPLTLTSFKGNLVDKKVQLNWASTNELNIKSFTIERSYDARNFTGIGSVEAKNTNEASYTFLDNTPIPGKSYYRLKMNDRDASVKLSNVVSINNRRGIIADIFPNPVVNNINVSHTKAGADALIRIFNASGQQVKVFIVAPGAIQTNLLVNDLIKGNYLLSFFNNGESTFTKFIKN